MRIEKKRRVIMHKVGITLVTEIGHEQFIETNSIYSSNQKSCLGWVNRPGVRNRSSN